MARYGKKAKLGHIRPHALRHSAAKLRRETGASIEDVGALLGHRSIATTAWYLARLEGEQDRADGIGSRHSLGFPKNKVMPFPSYVLKSASVRS